MRPRPHYPRQRECPQDRCRSLPYSFAQHELIGVTVLVFDDQRRKGLALAGGEFPSDLLGRVDLRPEILILGIASVMSAASDVGELPCPVVPILFCQKAPALLDPEGELGVERVCRQRNSRPGPRRAAEFLVIEKGAAVWFGPLLHVLRKRDHAASAPGPHGTSPLHSRFHVAGDGRARGGPLSSPNGTGGEGGAGPRRRGGPGHTGRYCG